MPRASKGSTELQMDKTSMAQGAAPKVSQVPAAIPEYSSARTLNNMPSNCSKYSPCLNSSQRDGDYGLLSVHPPEHTPTWSSPWHDDACCGTQTVRYGQSPLYCDSHNPGNIHSMPFCKPLNPTKQPAGGRSGMASSPACLDRRHYNRCACILLCDKWMQCGKRG